MNDFLWSTGRWPLAGLLLLGGIAAGEPARIGATPSAAPVLDVQVNERLLGAFQVSGRETQPRWEDGVLIRPDMRYTAYPTLGNADRNIHLNLNIDFGGTAQGGRSQQVLGRTAGATTVSHIQAHFEKPLYLTGAGIATGPLRGQPSISVDVHTYNDFRLRIARRVAHRKARQQAMQEVARRVPKSQAKLTAQVNQSAEQAVRSANGLLQENLRNISSAITDPAAFPFQAHLESRGSRGSDPGYLKVSLHSRSGANRQPPPEGELSEQAATRVRLHEDALTESLTPKLAGKQMKMGDLHRYLCDGKFGHLLQFCREEMPEETRNTSIVFDEVTPISVSFGEGEIRLTLNALYQVHKPGDQSGKGDVLTERSEGSETLAQTSPYSVEIVYELGEAGATRKRISVRERADGAGSPEGASQGAGDHGVLDLLKGQAQGFLDSVARRRIQSNFEQAFKEEIPFASLSLPTRFSAAEGGGAVQAAGSTHLVPLETRSEKGWLMYSQAMCSPEMGALGVRFQVDRSYSRPALVLTHVTRGSPADLSGLRPGDRLFWYQETGQKEYQGIEGSYVPFVNSVKATASRESAAKRTLNLVGLDGRGQRFEKSIALCPGALEASADVGALARSLRSGS